VGDPDAASPQLRSRLRVALRGAVQGVGFRPFVFRLATELGLTGCVNNSAQGVFIEVEGPRPELEKFLLRLEAEKPSRSFIHSLEGSWLAPLGHTSFAIRESQGGGSKSAIVLPDMATCPDCLSEILDPQNRRYFYPFTNCTNCGPRFSIIDSLPYDRANTSMKRFTMCPRCQEEYDDPRDRRFHAQPNACPVCGPRLELWSGAGIDGMQPELCVPSTGEGNRNVLETTAEAIRAGKIVAVKGLGGFHLLVAADDQETVVRLRELKHREEKPFAVMFQSLEFVKEVCQVSAFEKRLLLSPEAPIVLLRRHSAPSVARFSPAPSIAPNNPYLGVMLPYTPLHHLLLFLLGRPVVATSGNLSDEPLCIDEHEALERLHGIADFFLVHNRPIIRHVDDSVVRVIAGGEQVLRRARGYAPLPIPLPASEFEVRQVLAVGGHLKNAIALSVGPQVFISQHIGDLETDQANNAFERVVADFEKLYQAQPSVIAADAHPDYVSTKFARARSEQVRSHTDSCEEHGTSANSQREGPRLISVQHHVAHVLACMAENELKPPVLGISWDGTGYGLDGTVWGGEFFVVEENLCERVAHLRQFRLPGGDKAIKEPRRAALGLLHELFGEAVFSMDHLAAVRAFSKEDLASMRVMLARRLNAPLTSSAGRLFDVVASLTALRQKVAFEGQAAMELEFSIEGCETSEFYPVAWSNRAPAGESLTGTASSMSVLDWSGLVQGILSDLEQGVAISQISARFHNALVEMMLEVARELGKERVALSGGCFQNRYLTERAVRRLREEGFHPYWHQRVPPNDGGICLGQVLAALRG